jgi:hypothetical protein
VKLTGVKSNTMGVGAKLVASVAGITHMREMIANNSATQGEVAVHIGLGESQEAETLGIHWSSGITDVYKNVKPGRHQFEERAVQSIAGN